MVYFTFSPLEMSKEEAFERIKNNNSHPVGSIIHVTNRGFHYSASIGRPKALPETYLVKIESDDSLRIVDQSFS